MNTLTNITVYCGSNLGDTPAYYHGAKHLAQTLHQQDIRLIYGGGNVGLMGVIADEMLNCGGEVIGVIPTFLRQKEVAHLGISQLIETPDMPTRKAKLIELADGFIAMAGGLGTYEELFEVLSMAQLGILNKPIGLLNINGFYDPLLAMLKTTANSQFMPQENLTLLCVSDNPKELLEQMKCHTPISAKKWQTPAWLSED